MPSEREMIQVVAERVCGLTILDIEESEEPNNVIVDSPDIRSPYYGGANFDPFENWADAGMVLEALATKTDGVTVGLDGIGSICMVGLNVEVRQPTGPGAIGLAAYVYALANPRAGGSTHE